MIEQVINRKRALDPTRNRDISSEESKETPMLN